ncbi:MAG TPA: hypothetical protein VKT70_00045, partial [Stellaceae bacterium]|nr:hypothetical protein [Stellaceae bacterium]
MEFYIYFSWMFGAFVIGVEIWRYVRRPRIDPLTFISLMFLVVYVVAPNFVYATPPSSALYQRFIWLQSLPLEWPIYLTAALTIFFGYIGILAGYYFQFAPSSGELRPIASPRRLIILGSLFLLIGAASFLIFTEVVVGGIVKTIKWAPVIHAYPLAFGYHPLIFVKRFTFFCLPAPIFFIQALAYLQGRKMRLLVLMLFAVSSVFALAIIVLFGDRIILVSFVMMFVVPLMMRNAMAALTVLMVGSAVSVPYILFFHQFFRYLTGTAHLLGSLELPHQSLFDLLAGVFFEFSMPLSALLSTIQHVPDIEPFHYFTDLPLILPRFLPGSSLAHDLPPQLYEITTRALAGQVSWAINVDLLAMGWFSLGPVGVAVVTILYGRLARWIDRALPQ